MITVIVQLPFDDSALRNRCVNMLSAPPYAAALASTAIVRDGASARECSLRRSRSDGHAARVASALRVWRRQRRARSAALAARAATADARAASSALMRCILAAPIRCIAPRGLVRSPLPPPPPSLPPTWWRRRVVLLNLCASVSAAIERAKPSAACARNRLRGLVAPAGGTAARQYGDQRAHASPPSRRTAAGARLFAAAACAQCTSRDHARQPRTRRRSRRLRSSPPPNGPR